MQFYFLSPEISKKPSFDNLQVLNDDDDMEIFKSMRVDFAEELAGINFSGDKSVATPADDPSLQFTQESV